MKKITKLRGTYAYELKFGLKMKLTTLFLIVSLCYVHGSSYSQNTKITLDLKNTSIENVLNEIESLSEFKFLFKRREIDVDRTVSIKVRKQRIGAVLKKMFSEGKIDYKVFDKQIILIPSSKTNNIAAPIKIEQQQNVITGTVVDGSGAPLPGVNVVEKGTRNGTSTDFDGNYSITVGSSTSTLVFSYIGFTTKEIPLEGKSNISVTLVEDAEMLGEVVVTTALGLKRQKRSVGYAVQNVKAADVTLAAPVDISQGLQGKVAGLNINTSNGISNASSRIVIRGNNSLFGRNTPLIVVDGAIVDNSELEQGNVGNNQDNYRDWGNYLSYLDMSTVEDISVLKGPNAAALYGARGANGVILITSKKGAERDGLGIRYNLTTTMLDTYRYTEVQNEFGGGFRASLFTANPELPRTASGQPFPAILYPQAWSGNPYPEATGIDSFHGPIPGGYNTWDIYSWFGAGSSWGPRLDGTEALWWDGETRPYSPQPNNREYMFRQGMQTSHNLSFSSASDLGSIRVGLFHQDSKAIVENTNSKSTNFSLGSHVNISKVLSADINAAYNQNFRLNTPEIGNNNSWTKFNIYGMSREYRGLEKDLYFGEDDYDGYRVRFPGSYPHAEYSRDLFWDTYQNNDRLWRDEFLSTLKLNAEITPWLNAFMRTSVVMIGTRFEQTNNTIRPDGISEGRFRKTVSKQKTFNTDFMATFHKDNFLFDKFNASLTVGINSYSNNSAGVEGRNGSTFKVPNIYSLSNYVADNLGHFSDTTDPTTGSIETRYDVKSHAYIGLLNLSYNDYLFFELTGRQDYTSTLPKDNNSTFYPSVNTSFVFTDAFNMDSNILSYGTIRGTWGKSANAAEPYQLDNTYTTSTFGGLTTISRPDRIPPNNLTFQTSESKEIGTSLGFFNNRLNLDFTYYDIKSENQIMTSAISLASGASKVVFNSGVLTNKGIEFIINADIVRNDAFSWSASINGAKNTNKVVALAEGVEEQEIATVFGSLGAFMKASPGENYGTIYGTDFERDEQGRKQVQNIYNQDGSGEVIGTQYVVSTDVQKIGNAAPKLTGGVGNTFRYKNLSLNALVDFKLGGDIYSVDHAVAMGSGLAPETAAARNGGGLPYTFPDGTSADVGMVMEGFNIDDGRENDRVISPTNYYGITYAGWSHLNRPRSLSVFENSWAKLRELSLTYNFPKDLMGKTNIFQDLSISLVGRNLFYLYTTLPQKLNPEGINGTGNGQGLQWAAFPSIRSVGISIRAGF
ncbi:SusC/RagA family TonB-linked outer membrane protein [Flagellimonas onchidii]|uniref:SusC/RagA family TonB-linked outer membrane protein n=1 Tax=Flagellimonas onchidii TaxID=2562684 RepID=UPI0010A63EE8|nr:SusC/RagA family TonB-linked outer membrane protein [Allomuricauda onchidii]